MTYEIVPETVAGRLKHSVYKLARSGREFIAAFDTPRAAEEAVKRLKEGK